MEPIWACSIGIEGARTTDISWLELSVYLGSKSDFANVQASNREYDSKSEHSCLCTFCNSEAYEVKQAFEQNT